MTQWKLIKFQWKHIKKFPCPFPCDIENTNSNIHTFENKMYKKFFMAVNDSLIGFLLETT